MPVSSRSDEVSDATCLERHGRCSGGSGKTPSPGHGEQGTCGCRTRRQWPGLRCRTVRGGILSSRPALPNASNEGGADATRRFEAETGSASRPQAGGVRDLARIMAAVRSAGGRRSDVPPGTHTGAWRWPGCRFATTDEQGIVDQESRSGRVVPVRPARAIVAATPVVTGRGRDHPRPSGQPRASHRDVSRETCHSIPTNIWGILPACGCGIPTDPPEFRE
jgi:hypothetical protein